MSPFAQSLYSHVQKPRLFTRVVGKHILVMNVSFLALIVLFFVMYVVQVNSAVARAYQMRELESNIHELTIQNKQLQVAARESQSLDNVSSSLKMLGLVESDTTQYVQGGGSSYALAD